MTITIDPQRIERFLSPDTKLRSGVGTGVNGGFDACAMQAADWLIGGLGNTDAPECVDPVIRRFIIRLNDASSFGQWRDELKPYVLRSIDTKTDRATMRKRVFMCSDWACRVVAPRAFEFWGERVPARKDEANAWAKKLREQDAIIDQATARAARDLAREARSYADAYADADAAAYAAALAAAATAAEAATYATDATDATDAEAAAAFKREMWDLALAQLDALIKVTEAA